MINLDSSIVPAIVIFLVLIVALNKLLFKPLMKVQAERESRTTGLMRQTQENLNHHLSLLGKYQESIKNARMEGYRRQEQLRAEALKKRAEVLAQSRTAAERLIVDSRESIRAQVETEKQLLTLDAQEIAGSITATILGRSDLKF
ncbi:MAG: ATP synthase F0 subunit B [Acidobacteriota bacterium]|jgi:F-type H+-transporting ATPase subunit b|nr:ATP synthase F0 subunit B [Acidobacteriota bacterium]